MTRAGLIRDLSVLLLMLPLAFLVVVIVDPGDLLAVVLLLLVSTLASAWFAWRVRRWQAQARLHQAPPEADRGA